MKKLLKISMLIAVLAMSAISIQAQKFGHLNSGNILSQMSETKVSDDALKVYQDSLIKVGQERAKILKSDFDTFMAAYQQGDVPPIQAQKKQEEIQRREQELIAYEKEVGSLVAQKRKKLLEPILDRLEKAIDEVGKEHGYTMIFDTSLFNAILFAEESEDLEGLIKEKLNMP